MSIRCPLPYERVRAGIARANDLQFGREPEDDPYEQTAASKRAVARVKAARSVHLPFYARPFRRWYIARQLKRMGL